MGISEDKKLSFIINLKFKILFDFIDIQLIYNIFISNVQQSNSHLHIYMYIYIYYRYAHIYMYLCVYIFIFSNCTLIDLLQDTEYSSLCYANESVLGYLFINSKCVYHQQR